MAIDFVTPVKEYGSPTGPITVISRSTRPFISNYVMYVGVAGDNNNVVQMVGAIPPNSVTIDGADGAGAGIRWFRLSRPRGNKITIEAKDAKGAVLASFNVSVVDLPKASGPMEFEIEADDPKAPGRINLRVYAPKDDGDYIDNRMVAIGYNIYLQGFQVYCSGLNTPIEVPNTLLDLKLTQAEPIDAEVYDTLDEAKDAIQGAPPKAAGVTPIAYYRGAGGAVIAPTVFSAGTTPRIIATYLEARTLYAQSVEKALAGIAIGLVGGMVFRAILGRLLRARSGDSKQRVPPPVLKAKIKPVNGTVNVGGGGEIPDVTNLNPIKRGSGGPEFGIPNHVKGGMEEMEALFEPGSVKSMYSQRLRYVDVDWNVATRAAAKVMPPGGKVFMNVWTQTQQEMAALLKAFEAAGFKNVRISGSGAGTMVEAVR